MLVLVHGFTDFSIWSADSVASGLVINRVSYQKAVVEQQTDHLLVARKQRDKQKGTRMTVAKPPFAKVHKCNADSCPYGEAWRIGSPYGKDLQALLAFPEGMLGSLLPCLAIGNLYSQVVFDRHFPRIRKGKPGLWFILVCLWGSWEWNRLPLLCLLMMVMWLSQHKALVWVHQLKFRCFLLMRT